MKINLRVEIEGEKEKEWGRVVSHMQMCFQTRSTFSSTMNCDAVKQSSPQGHKLWAGSGDPSVLSILLNLSFSWPNSVMRSPCPFMAIVIGRKQSLTGREILGKMKSGFSWTSNFHLIRISCDCFQDFHLLLLYLLRVKVSINIFFVFFFFVFILFSQILLAF